MKLVEVCSDIWAATQPLKFFGLEVGSRMTLVRLPSGDLVIISPIELKDSDRDQIEDLGSVRYIIAPNRFHHMSVESISNIFPDAEIIGVPGLQEKQPHIRFSQFLEHDGDFESVLHYLPVQGFATLIPPSIQEANEVVFWHQPSGTLIMTDTAFNFDENSDRILQALTKLTGSYKLLRPTFLEKLGTRDKSQVKQSIQQALKWEFDRVIPGHGSIVDTGGKEQLIQGYEWFLGTSL